MERELPHVENECQAVQRSLTLFKFRSPDSSANETIMDHLRAMVCCLARLFRAEPHGNDGKSTLSLVHVDSVRFRNESPVGK
jgi:hypothetical protein